MSQVRLNFVNWAPDLEDELTDGLTVADNVFHQAEGYKPVALFSTGSFSTLTNVGTVLSMHVRPAGAAAGTGADSWVAAWINQLNGSTVALRIGTPSGGAFSGTSSATMTSVTSTAGALVARVVAFDVCELNDKVFVTAVGQAATSATTSTLTYLTGYITPA